MKECDKAIQIAITFGGGKKESPEINAQFEVAIRHLKKCGNPQYVHIISDIKCCIADPLSGLDVGRQ